MKKIFIAFTGQKIDQKEEKFIIDDGFECWNLKKFSFDQFTDGIRQIIPPLNEYAIRTYKKEQDVPNALRITQERYDKDTSWGLLFPNNLPDPPSSGCGEITFLLNLFAPNFLYPTFYVTEDGIEALHHNKQRILWVPYQNRSEIFKTKEFIKFFKQLINQSVYGVWQKNISDLLWLHT